MAASWLTQSERGSRVLMELIAWITLRLGRPAGRLLLYPICLYFVIFSRRARLSSRHYLSRILQREPGFWELFRHYHTFACTIHDRVYLLSGRYKHFDVHVEGDPALDSELAKGRGCILLGSHLGSFEILRARGLFESKLPLNVLMHEEHAEKLNSVLHGLQPGIRPRIIRLGRPDTLLRAKECLDRGEIVGILGDRAFGDDKTVVCDFLGAPAPFPEGPLLLAAILQVPVVLFVGLHQGGRRYDIYLEVLADRIVLERQKRTEQLRPWIERYAARLEHYCRLAPYNWFNFYDFWREEET